MRRATLLSGLALPTVAVLVLAFVGHVRSPAPEAQVGKAPLVQPLAASEESAKPPAAPRLAAPEQVEHAQAPTEGVPDAGLRTSPDIRLAPPDEDAIRERIRKQAAPDIELTYALLLEHLGLSTQEKQALLSLLIDMQVEGTSYISHGKVVLSGRPVGTDERSYRIASVIGDSKLRQFLGLERNLPSYWEVGRLGSLLQQNGVPLSDVQRDGLFKILAEVRDQYRSALPPGIEPRSIEAMEYQIARRSEYERHVMELAPSVLTPNQVANVDEQYQYLSYQRTNDLERDRKKRADDPTYPLTIPVWN